MNAEIIVATKHDVDRLVHIGRTTFYDTFFAQNTATDMQLFLDEHFTAEKITAEISNTLVTYLLVVAENKTIGYCKLKTVTHELLKQNSVSIEIEQIYIDAALKGKGIGSQLMEYIIHSAKQNGCNALWLGVWEHNQPAIQFYNKYRFEKFSEHAFVLGTDVQNDWLMVKYLD